MEFLKFIFSNFWTFIGFFLLCCVATTVIKGLFDFIVELIHGKPTIQNITVDKIEEKKKAPKEKNPPKATKDVNSDVIVDGGEVEVRRN